MGSNGMKQPWKLSKTTKAIPLCATSLVQSWVMLNLDFLLLFNQYLYSSDAFVVGLWASAYPGLDFLRSPSFLPASINCRPQMATSGRLQFGAQAARARGCRTDWWRTRLGRTTAHKPDSWNGWKNVQIGWIRFQGWQDLSYRSSLFPAMCRKVLHGSYSTFHHREKQAVCCRFCLLHIHKLSCAFFLLLLLCEPSTVTAQSPPWELFS